MDTVAPNRVVKLVNPEGYRFAIQELTRNPEYHDLEVILEDGTKAATFSKLVLAASSPVMRTSLKECEGDIDQMVSVTIIGYSSSEVQRFLDLVSFGECSVPTQSHYENVMNLMKCFGMTASEHVKEEKHDKESCPTAPEVMFIDSDISKAQKRNQQSIIWSGLDNHEVPGTKQSTTSPGKPKELFHFQCTHCNKVVRSRWFLMSHMKIHIGESAFRCKICQVRIQDTRQLSYHQSSHGTAEVETYAVCRTEYRKSTGSHHYDCSYCNVRIRGEWPFVLHLTGHEGDKARECRHCGKILTTSDQWYHHKAWHKSTGEVCDLCGKVQRTIDALNWHKAVVHNKETFECHVCQKRLATKGNLHKHIQEVHGTEKNFVCEICAKATKSKGQLQKHRKTHSQDRPFKCDLCSKSFLSKLFLSEHRAGHTNERNFACPQCDKTFTSERRMKEHSDRVHGGYKAVCGLCNVTFKQLSDVNRHLITHTDLKPYCCTECTACFNHAETARRHFRAVHPQKKIKIKFVKSIELEELRNRAVKKLGAF